MIVDVHAHIFPQVYGNVADGPTRGLGYGHISIGNRVEQLMPPGGEKTAHTVETLIATLDWAGVERAMLLQGSYYGPCNPYVLEAVARYPERLWGAAFLDPWAPGSREAAAEVLAAPGFRALKLECSVPTGLCGLHPDARLDDAALDWLWAELERRGRVLVLDLGAVRSRSYQTGAVRSLAQRYPALRVVIAHLAQPTPRAEADAALWNLWQEQIDLGRLPNVWFDCAALPAYVAEEGYPFPTAGRYLRTAIERIGSDKVMWGSDLPGMLVHATYPQLVKLGELHTQFLSASERELVMGGNALRVYGTS